MRQVSIVSLLFAAALGPVAFAQEIGSPARGLVYVRDRCAECHAVEAATKQSPVRAAPSFVTVANIPGMTPMALTAWLHSSHKLMPNLIVHSEDLGDVIAYIRSLKSSPPAEK